MIDVNSNGQEMIRVLEYPENIRQKFGMYIDSPSTMLREIIDNSTDEVLSCKTCDTIIIDTDFNGYNLVADRGRGIPIFMSLDRPTQTQADVAVSTVHAGSKFVNTDSKVGSFGVGSAAVNALSSIFWVLSKVTLENYNGSLPVVKEYWESLGPRMKKDVFYYACYQKGYKTAEGVGRRGDLEKLIFGGSAPKSLPTDMSTITLFQVDQEIFPNPKVEIPVENLQNFLFIQEKFYRRKVSVVANGAILTADNIKPYSFEILKTITPADISKNPYIGVYVTFEIDPALNPKSETGSINGLVVNSGCHIQYMEKCFEDALREEYKIKHKTIFPGFKMFAILLCEDLVYDSQIKSRVRQISKVKQTDFQEITKEFVKIFRKNDDYWRAHVEKLNALAESYRSIGAVEKAQKMIDGARGNNSFKMKAQNYVEGFSDATSNDRWNCELLVTEGLSAAGGLKAGRKSTLYHAILPLRGKILSVKDSSIDEALANKEIFTLLNTIGLGVDVNFVGQNCTTPEETYAEIQKHARYGKIILTTDSDSDGSHIQNLILYLIAKYARFLIDYGMVYILVGPLFEQKGKFFFPGDPLQPGTNFPVGLDPKIHFRRYKGLGSVVREQVYDAFFNPATRRLIQVTPEGIDYFLSLVENIDIRKDLLTQVGILGNPFNLTDV